MQENASDVAQTTPVQDEYADDVFEPHPSAIPAEPQPQPLATTAAPPSEVVHACIVKYMEELATDTAHNVIIIRAIANNRKVLMGGG